MLLLQATRRGVFHIRDQLYAVIEFYTGGGTALRLVGRFEFDNSTNFFEKGKCVS